MTILHIETSHSEHSVAVSKEGEIVQSRECINSMSVCALADEMLSYTRAHGYMIDAISVSTGPGSYTGLRIGSSLAKGLAYGLDIPVIALSTLKIMTVPLLLYRDDLPDEALFLPMIDARRMEVFAAIYDRALNEVRGTQADIVSEDTYRLFAQQAPLYYFGSGAEKCKVVMRDAYFIDGIKPSARQMMPLAETAFRRGDFADVAYFEPQYAKDFEAIKSRDMLKETRKEIHKI